MKPPATPIIFLAVVCLLVAACSRPEEKRDTRAAGSESSSPPPRPSHTPFDPWKVAAEQPVPAGPVGDAQRFLLNVPAYQYTSEGEDLNTHQKSHGEGRVVRNEALWVESTGPYGKNGIITDGKREFVFYQGRYGQEPGDADATLMDQLKQTSLQSLLEYSEEHTPFLGTEKVEGIEAETYALNILREDALRGMVPAWALEGGHLRVWIAKENHRPLKIEWKENRSDRQKPGVTHVSVETRTYRYDPNVKVTLPGS